MNTDDFEKRLQQQPMRQIPAEWRHEILQNAKSSLLSRQSPSVTHQTPWWKDLLWPCPQAWVGLAAVWLVILGLNFEFKSHQAPQLAKNSTPVPDFLAIMQEQQRLMTELVDSHQPAVAERPKMFRFGPRSQYRREECLVA